MKRLSKPFMTILIVCLSVIVVIGGQMIFAKSKSLKAATHNARSKGNPSAPLKIVEYIDFQCPACAKGAKFLREYYQKFPDQIYLELKYFPLSAHRFGLQSAKYAECAAQQGKFWQMHDLLIDRQEQWRDLTNATAAFQIMAVEADLNIADLDRCLVDPKTEKIIQEARLDGEIAKVSSTPSYFVNGEMIVGSKSLEEYFAQHFQSKAN